MQLGGWWAEGVESVFILLVGIKDTPVGKLSSQRRILF